MKFLWLVTICLSMCVNSLNLPSVYAKTKEQQVQVETQKPQKNWVPCKNNKKAKCQKHGPTKKKPLVGRKAPGPFDSQKATDISSGVPDKNKTPSTEESITFQEVKDPALIQESKFTITTNGYDFGGIGFAFGIPTTGGALNWLLIDGEIQPNLSGYLHLHGVYQECARMRMDFYTQNYVLLDTKYGGQVCAEHWGLGQGRGRVDLNRVDSQNSYRHREISEVKVSLETLMESDKWTSVGSQTLRLQNENDAVKITEGGFDFGDGTFTLGVPTKSGEVNWNNRDGIVKPHVTGKLWINNAAAACARMQIEYFDLHGKALATKPGGKVCASDNKLHSWNVDLQPYELDVSVGTLAYIYVGLQTLGTDGRWRTLGREKSEYLTSWRW